jgi:hypothetical protein
MSSRGKVEGIIFSLNSETLEEAYSILNRSQLDEICLPVRKET